jgi:hypothetical protein
MSASRNIKRSKFRFLIGVVSNDVQMQIGVIQLFENSFNLVSNFSILFFELTVSDSIIKLSAQYCSFRIDANFWVPSPYSLISSLQHCSQFLG